jgi:hypothetical protein
MNQNYGSPLLIDNVFNGWDLVCFKTNLAKALIDYKTLITRVRSS